MYIHTPPNLTSFKLNYVSQLKYPRVTYTGQGIVLRRRPANERRRYIVTSSLIGWAHSQNDLWGLYDSTTSIHYFNYITSSSSYLHYIITSDVIMSAMAFQITSLTIVYSTAYSCTYQGKHQSSASLAFVWPVTGEFPTQRASNAENNSIWWRHHVQVECRFLGERTCCYVYLYRDMLHACVRWQ